MSTFLPLRLDLEDATTHTEQHWYVGVDVDVNLAENFVEFRAIAEARREEPNAAPGPWLPRPAENAVLVAAAKAALADPDVCDRALREAADDAASFARGDG